MSRGQQFPAPTEPIADPGGHITRSWFALLNTLWLKAAGGTVTGTGTTGRLVKWVSTIGAIGDADLTGDVTTSGATATTLATSGVTPGTYGDSTHVARVTFDVKGRATAASPVLITGVGGSWVPLALGMEPLTFVSDGAGNPILVSYTP